MKKIVVGVLFGGASPEHKVSKMTAKSILTHIDKDKFDVIKIYVDKRGNFGREKLKNIDIAFLAFHGENYEDGKFQQYLDKRGIKYTGSGAEASAVNMDKELQKIAFLKAGLKTVECVTIDNNYSLDKNHLLIAKTVGYPCFIKPSNTGSSIGISRAENKSDLKKAIVAANKIGSKIIAEKAVDKPRELEVAILGNEKLLISDPGEVLTHGNFYSYETKYFKPFETTTKAKNLDKKIVKQVKNWAEKAYRITDCKGYARVDFFLDQKGELYINEINTLSGFTAISMFPKLMKVSGINYKNLITKIIELGLE